MPPVTNWQVPNLASGDPFTRFRDELLLVKDLLNSGNSGGRQRRRGRARQTGNSGGGTAQAGGQSAGGNSLGWNTPQWTPPTVNQPRPPSGSTPWSNLVPPLQQQSPPMVPMAPNMASWQAPAVNWQNNRPQMAPISWFPGISWSQLTAPLKDQRRRVLESDLWDGLSGRPQIDLRDLDPRVMDVFQTQRLPSMQPDYIHPEYRPQKRALPHFMKTPEAQSRASQQASQ